MLNLLLLFLGTVQDQNQKGIDLALISLKRTSADSTYIKTEYSDQDGSFQMKEVPIRPIYSTGQFARI
ncbi:MAG: hypothetical protein IPI60_18850 [Saprospiraceae bacterium]|nr:hypothetical protein [Saprospiraceae bacterium]